MKARCKAIATATDSCSATTAKPTSTCRPTRCARCCTRTASRRASCGRTARGRPEGRVVEIVERPRAADHRPTAARRRRLARRAGRQALRPGRPDPQGRHRHGQGRARSWWSQLTEPPALFGQPVGRVKEVLGEIDDPGMEIEIAVRKYGVPHEFSEACLAQAKALPDKVRPADKKGRVDLTDVPLVTIDGEDARDFDDAVYCEPAKVGPRQGLAPAGRHRRRQRLCADRFGDRHRRLRPRHQRVLSAPRDSDAAGEAVQRPVLAQPRGRAPVHGVRHAGGGRRRDLRLPVLSGGDVQPCALHLHRGGGDPGQHARPRGGQAQGPRQGPAQPARRLPRAAQAARASAARSISRPPRRRSSATTPAASRRSCRARATRRTG